MHRSSPSRPRRSASRLVRLICVLSAIAAASLAAAAGSPAASPTTPAIINGTQLSAGDIAQGAQWDSLVGLVSDINNPLTQFCGGTLVADDWVLTAAHCVWYDTNADDMDDSIHAPSDISIITDALDERNDTFVTRTVTAIYPHESYCPPAPATPDCNVAATPGDNSDDVALLHLSSAIAATDAEPMPLIQAGESGLWDVGRPAYAAGWGNTSAFTNSYPDLPSKVTVPINSDSTCNDTTIGGYTTTDFVAAKMLCGSVLDSDGVANTTNGQDTCQGDSGGPLIVDDGTQRRLIGVTSWGVGCAEDSFGVYAEVNNYRTWVNDTVTGNSASTLPTTNANYGTAPACASTVSLQDPTGVTATPTSSTTVRVNWTRPVCGTPPDGFDVWQMPSTTLLARQKNPSLSSLTIGKLTPATTYHLNVDASCCGVKLFSGGVDVAVTTPRDTVKPGLPGKAKLTRRTRTSVSIKWAAAKDNDRVVKYQVFQKVRGRWKKIGTTTKLSGTIGRLSPGQRVLVTIKAVDRSGNVSAYGPTAKFFTKS